MSSGICLHPTPSSLEVILDAAVAEVVELQRPAARAVRNPSIVQVSLGRVHTTASETTESGAPGPTLARDPEGAASALEECHFATR